MPDPCEKHCQRVVCVDRFCGPCWRNRALWLEGRLGGLSVRIAALGKCPGCDDTGEVLATSAATVSFVPCPLACAATKNRAEEKSEAADV